MRPIPGPMPAWDDLRVSLEQTRVNPATSKPDYDTFISGTKVHLFDPAAIESVTFSVQFPHDYKQGTTIAPHIHWSPTSTNTGVVRWGLEYTWIDVFGTFGATTTIYVEQAGGGVTNAHQMANFPDIAGTAITGISSMMMCRLFRDATHANDTYTGDAAALEFDIHYQKDGFGSTNRGSK